MVLRVLGFGFTLGGEVALFVVASEPDWGSINWTWRGVVLFAGYPLEFAGLCLAALGLWRTWHENAEGAPFFPDPVRRAVRWFQRVVLRQRPVAIRAVGSMDLSGLGALEGHGSAWSEFSAEMSVEEKLEAVQANARRALDAAALATAAVAKERATRESQFASLEQRLAGAEVELKAHAKRLVVEGIPLAVAGLVLVALGLVLQAYGSI